MMKNILLCVCFFVLESSASSAPFIKPCLWSDNECMLSSAVHAMPYFLHGLPDFGIEPALPLTIKDANADQGETKLSFKNMVVTAFDKCKFIKITRDIVKSTLSLEVETPIEVTGLYSLSGKLLLLDVSGNGDFRITIDKLRLFADVNLITTEKNGIKYYGIDKFTYKYDIISKADIQFENLFNGDQKKAEPMNEIIKQNPEQLINDMGKPIFDKLLNKIVALIKKFIQSVPAKDLEITP